MPWKSEPDPFEERRRQLESQRRQLEEQRRRLTDELSHSGDPAAVKRAEPPVWRMEEEEPRPLRSPELTPARRRHLAHQRRRDLIIFIGCLVLLVVVVAIVLWVAYVRNSLPGNGS